MPFWSTEILNLDRLIKICAFTTLMLWKGTAANKYCAFEFDGEPKYYICQRNEHCCSIGCCVNLAFHFYQLWYYWLLVIFMFMVCSGGGWWYRFCRNPARTVVSRSPYPSSSNNLNGGNASTNHNNRHDASYHHADRGHTHHQRARMHRSTPISNTRRQSSSAYYLQRIWKNPNMIPQQALPPSYSTMFLNLNSRNNRGQTADQQTRLPCEQQSHRTSCPYQQLYQLYGPPPSYDSVIQVTTNGISCQLVESVDDHNAEERQSLIEDPNLVGIEDEDDVNRLAELQVISESVSSALIMAEPAAEPSIPRSSSTIELSSNDIDRERLKSIKSPTESSSAQSNHHIPM